MFDPSLFRYESDTHTGYYDNKIVPSITQLLDIIYPYSSDIPKERLDKAAEYGTKVHNAIEQINEYFDTPFEYEQSLSVAIEIASQLSAKLGLKELIDYVSFLSAYKLKPYDYEKIVFLLNDNQDIICYGHFDCIFQAQEDIVVNGKTLFVKGCLYLFDFKTTSLFAKVKVALQESAYSIAYEQGNENYISNIYGMWFDKGKTKIIPLNRQDTRYTLALFENLKESFDERIRK